MQIKRNKNGFLICDFKIVDKYKYKAYSRNDESLAQWRKRVGEEQATRITVDAARRGTEMHLVLEKYCQAIPYLNLTSQGNQSRLMAHTIVENLGKLKEIWGSEVHLMYEEYCPSLYPDPKNMAWAGQTDVVGLYDDKPTIIDFKQANKLKKKEWIEDYYYQIAAYSLAHKAYYGEITQGIIAICTRNYEYQQFIMDEDKLLEYENKWMDRAYEYYKKLSTSSPKT